MRLLVVTLVAGAALLGVLAAPAIAADDGAGGETFELGPPSSPTTDPGEIASRRFHHTAEVSAAGPRALRVRVWCSAACRADVSLRIGPAAARLAGLERVIVTRSARLGSNHPADITLRLGTRVSRALRAAGVGSGRISAEVAFERLG